MGVNGSETKPGIVQVTKAIAPSWADEIEEDDEYYDRTVQTFSLPTAPRASRSLDDVPEEPPFIAHLSNLPFDVEDEEIYQLFGDQEVENLRVPREDGGERSRGFGYIEFKTRNDLIAALTLPDPSIHGRRVRIEISNDADQKRGGRGGRFDGDSSNWRREGGRNDEEGGGRRNNYSISERTRDWSSNADEEGGNWRQSLKVKSDSPPPIRRSNFDRDDREHRGGYDRGGDRDRGSYNDRPLTRSNISESDRPLTRSNISDNDRPITRSNITESDRPISRSNINHIETVVAERPKLNLQKRTLPLPDIIVAPEDEEKVDVEEPTKRAEPKSVPAVDIFGEAKPVDTAARERAIEEKLESIRLAQAEAAEKERLEREAAKAAATAAAAAAAETAEKAADEKGENGDAKDQPAPAVNNWRVRNEDHSTNGNGDAPRTQSPSRRRFSPDRRGGPRRIGK